MKKHNHITLNILLFFAVFMAYNNHSSATMTTAQTDGFWHNAGTWDNGAPGCFDTIVIPAGIMVEVANNENLTACGPISIILFGNLHFQQGSQLQLPCGSWIYVAPGGSITANNYDNNGKKIKICGNTEWQGKDGQITGPAGVGPAPLPIELLYFEAELDKEDRKVNLYWATASESDNDYFTIERSTDGLSWEVVTTSDGAGNSSQKLSYTSIDADPYMGKSYYRLKQTDFNGDFTYSPPVGVNQQATNEIIAYPNPVSMGNDIVVLFPEGHSSVQDVMIYSMDGRLVKTVQIDFNVSRQLILNTSDLQKAGCYVIKSSTTAIKVTVD